VSAIYPKILLLDSHQAQIFNSLLYIDKLSTFVGLFIKLPTQRIRCVFFTVTYGFSQFDTDNLVH